MNYGGYLPQVFDTPNVELDPHASKRLALPVQR